MVLLLGRALKYAIGGKTDRGINSVNCLSPYEEKKGMPYMFGLFALQSFKQSSILLSTAKLGSYVPTWHGPDFTCNFPQTVLRPTETDQSQIYPKLFLCFDSHLLVNISRCSSQHLSVISCKHCLCLQLELRPTGTPVRLKNPDYLGLKTQTLPDHSLKNARLVGQLSIMFILLVKITCVRHSKHRIF